MKKRVWPKSPKNQDNIPVKKQKIAPNVSAIEDASQMLIAAMERLIEALPYAEKPGPTNSLINAMQSGDRANILIMLEQIYISLSGETALGAALIRWALINDYDDIVKTVALRGINLNNPKLIHVMLMRACTKGYEDIVNHLLNYDNISVNTKDCFEHNALIKAIQCKHKAIAKMLVRYRPTNKEIMLDMISTALAWAILRNFDQPKIIQTLIKYHFKNT